MFIWLIQNDFQLNLLDDGYSHIGRFLGETTKHWSEREITWTFSQLDSHLQLRKKIDRFYSCEHGQFLPSLLLLLIDDSFSVGIEHQLEYAIRSCFRLVYFDSIRLHAHRGCLLNVILYKQPIWFQARLIYLLFGPMSHGNDEQEFLAK